MTHLKILKTAGISFVMSLLLINQTVSAESLKINGSTTVFANIFEPFKDKLQQTTGLTLEITSNGSSRGLKDLLTDKADLGMISSSMDAMAKKVGTVEGLEAHRIGTGRVAFITHSSNPVKKLTQEQIKSILLGTVKNWSEVGGKSQPIVIIAEYKGGGIRSTVEKKLLEKKPFSGKMKELSNGTQIVKVAAQVPGSFGVASAATLNDRVIDIELDQKMEQPLILVTKGTPSASAKKLIEAAKSLSIG